MTIIGFVFCLPLLTCRYILVGFALIILMDTFYANAAMNSPLDPREVIFAPVVLIFFRGSFLHGGSGGCTGGGERDSKHFATLSDRLLLSWG